MNTEQQKSNYITAVRSAAKKIIDGIEELETLRSHWNAEDLGNILVDADYVGDNTGITQAQLTAVIGTTHDALVSLMSAGHNTNLYRLK